MKKIIDGKLYDTEKAEEICEYSYSHCGDFRYIWEVLYKSSTGQFFISYEGGPMTQYGVSCGQNEKSGSSGIRLVGQEEAQEFTEKNGDCDDYANTFGEPERG